MNILHKAKRFFAKDTETDLVIALNDAIMEKCEYGERLEILNDAERVLYLVNLLETEVSNGGFDQYFDNASGDHAPETVVALRTIGADWAAELLEKALVPFGESYPADLDKRADIMDAQGEDAQRFAVWSACDDAFYEGEADSRMGLTSRCYAYAVKNRAALKTLKAGKPPFCVEIMKET